MRINDLRRKLSIFGWVINQFMRYRLQQLQQTSKEGFAFGLAVAQYERNLEDVIVNTIDPC